MAAISLCSAGTCSSSLLRPDRFGGASGATSSQKAPRLVALVFRCAWSEGAIEKLSIGDGSWSMERFQTALWDARRVGSRPTRTTSLLRTLGPEGQAPRLVALVFRCAWSEGAIEELSIGDGSWSMERFQTALWDARCVGIRPTRTTSLLRTLGPEGAVRKVPEGPGRRVC